jgi:hypothetical protein
VRLHHVYFSCVWMHTHTHACECECPWVQAAGLILDAREAKASKWSWGAGWWGSVVGGVVGVVATGGNVIVGHPFFVPPLRGQSFML